MINRLMCILACAFLLSSTAVAVDIEGVQPAALDQPRINVALRRDAKGKTLSAKGGGLGSLLGGAVDADQSTINIQAFLDTGASGIMISGKTAESLGIKHMTIRRGGTDEAVQFHDIGVGGTDAFEVSEKLFIFMAASSGEPDNEADYSIGFGPVRTQISQGGGLIEQLTGGLDVMGMPAMKGRVIVIDPKPVNSFSDTMKVQILSPKQRQQVPKTDVHVKLTYVDFKRFTHVEPPGAEFPIVSANPMIGPDPTNPAASKAVGAGAAGGAVIASHNGKQVAGTWLLDTGAAASMISKRAAEQLGVKYVAGTEGGDKPKLASIPDDKQFSLSIGGVGGTKKVAGFYLDSLTIPTRERQPLVYKPAPVMVVDITVEDPKTKQQVTLDGVFGMNYMVASAYVAEAGLMPDIKNLTQGPFEWIVFDEPAGMLGLKLRKEFATDARNNKGNRSVAPTGR